MQNLKEKLKTRARVVDLLRREQRTVDQLARALGVTDNAVRLHLEALEREGIVRQIGLRRSGSAGKPAIIYEIDPQAETTYSRVYAPMLVTLIATLSDRMSEGELEAVMRETGRRLALLLRRSEGDLFERVRSASSMLNQLGALTTVESLEGAGVVLIGAGCPLSAATSSHEVVCTAVGELLTVLIGTLADKQCSYVPRPTCRFSFNESK